MSSTLFNQVTAQPNLFMPAMDLGLDEDMDLPDLGMLPQLSKAESKAPKFLADETPHFKAQKSLAFGEPLHIDERISMPLA